MDILTAVYQILMMLGIALIGLWLRRRDVFSPPVIKGVNAIVLQVAMPALVLMISQKDYTPEVMDSFWRILLASTVLLAAGGVGLFLLSKRFVQPDRRAAFAAMVMLPNAAFMGIPIVTALYGDLGVAYLSGFIAAFNVAGWTAFHALFADRHANPLKPLMNAGFISTLVALALIYFRIRLPVPFVSLFTQLGNLTTPLGMLLAGARLYELKPALLERGVHFDYKPEVLALVAKKAYGHKSGARDIRRVIRKEVEDPLSLTIATAQDPPALVLVEPDEAGESLILRTE